MFSYYGLSQPWISIKYAVINLTGMVCPLPQPLQFLQPGPIQPPPSLSPLECQMSSASSLASLFTTQLLHKLAGPAVPQRQACMAPTEFAPGSSSLAFWWVLRPSLTLSTP